MNPCEQPLHVLHQMRTTGEISTEEIAKSVLARIQQAEPKLHAYLAMTDEKTVLENARKADKKRTSGEVVHPLEGMPITLKDIFCTQGMETTCGSKMLKGFVPPYDATVVEKLKHQGLNLTGKTNMDEFAMGSSTENSAYGPTKNPWDTSRVPGGSSGGTAAAVAAGMALAGLGTDTGGSIRQPASFTSLVGLKPTYGRVSRYGMIAFASSLDQGGVLTRDAEDAALLLGAIAGHDPRDSTSADRPVPDYTQALQGDLKGVRLGLVKQFQGAGLDKEVEDHFQANLNELQGLGAEVVEVSLPALEYALAVYYILAPSEASSNLGRFDGIRYGLRSKHAEDLSQVYQKSREEGFGPEVKRRIMLGTFALSAGYYDAYYNKALNVRRMLSADFNRAFQQVSMIVCPTSPVPPFKLGERLSDPLQMYLVDSYTLPVNLAGLPGMSIPGGFTKGGLPLGLQFIAPAFQEEKLLQAAHGFQQVTDYHLRRPVM
ncbi:MAG: Asp-tRNA(Asn)/Glu-tRNA(Gln) amidotransferase subunit GatA [Deltaproteobacteria bacterium]|nr:Asp-tRNA(Asn)/Glu-tRNA(Gln) amidotransferase subunit GatA [Deltaproteobacteria bacterium]